MFGKFAHKDFYISNLGSGTGIGTQADPVTPAQIVASPSTYFGGTYAPYDTTFWFNRGEIFDFQFNVLKPSEIKAYGSGDKPIIRGSDDISTGWTHDGSDIYYRSMSTAPKAIFVDGSERKQAQTLFMNVTAFPALDQVTGDQTTLDALNATESLVGSVLLQKEAGFRPNYPATVTAYSAGVLTHDNIGYRDYYGYSRDANIANVDDQPFILLGKKSFIDQVGEWMYDSAAERVYIKTAGGAPTNIRACTRDYGILFSTGMPDMLVENIEFQHQYLEGIYSVSNNNISVSYCDFNHIHFTGVSLVGNSENINISFCTFGDVNGNAIHIGGVQGGTITRNTINNINLLGGIVQPEYDYFRDVGNGIHIRWDNLANNVATGLDINYNNITNVGYCGIVFVGKNHTIDYNIVDGFGQKWADGGGIYGIHRIFGQGSVTRDVLIDHNIVRNGLGLLEGYPSDVGYMGGIYVDNNSTLVTITNNTIETIRGYGILINFHVTACTVTDNKIVDCTLNNAFYNDGPTVDRPFWGFKTIYFNSISHVFEDNIVASRQNVPLIYATSSNASFNPFSSGGSTANNHYVNPYSGTIADYRGTTMNLGTWASTISGETSSTSRANYLTYSNAANALEEVKVEINDTEAAVNFNVPVGYSDYEGNPFSNPVTIQPYESIVYFKDTEFP